MYVIGENIQNIAILDQTGKTIGTYKNTNSLNIEQLDKGVYFAHIEGLQGMEVFKFIKE